MSENENTQPENQAEDDFVELTPQTDTEAQYMAFRQAMLGGLDKLTPQDRRQLYSRLKLEFGVYKL